MSKSQKNCILGCQIHIQKRKQLLSKVCQIRGAHTVVPSKRGRDVWNDRTEVTAFLLPVPFPAFVRRDSNFCHISCPFSPHFLLVRALDKCEYTEDYKAVGETLIYCYKAAMLDQTPKLEESKEVEQHATIEL